MSTRNASTGAGAAARAGTRTRRTTTRRPAARATTLAIDIGGTGLKASVLDHAGAPLVDRVRVATAYPLPPDGMVETLAVLVEPLPPFDRVSAGFPGMVRGGLILSAPHFVTEHGPGSAVSEELERAWDRFDLAGALEERLGKPTKVVNDADLQGAAVVEGDGLELVITLGTGFGTALYHDGILAPHLELAHHRFRKGETYNQQLGEQARERVGKTRWNRRVARAIAALDALLFFDHLYVGGGNAKHLTIDLGPKGRVVDNSAGILGGIKLWERDHPVAARRGTAAPAAPRPKG